MINLFWSEDFAVKSLKPSFSDTNDVASPLAGIVDAAAVTINTDSEDAKVLNIYFDPTVSNIFKVQVSYDGTTFSDGYIIIKDNFELPIEGVKAVKLTNQSGATRTVSFALLSVA